MASLADLLCAAAAWIAATYKHHVTNDQRHDFCMAVACRCCVLPSCVNGGNLQKHCSGQCKLEWDRYVTESVWTSGRERSWSMCNAKHSGASTDSAQRRLCCLWQQVLSWPDLLHAQLWPPWHLAWQCSAAGKTRYSPLRCRTRRNLRGVQLCVCSRYEDRQRVCGGSVIWTLLRGGYPHA